MRKHRKVYRKKITQKMNHEPSGRNVVGMWEYAVPCKPLSFGRSDLSSDVKTQNWPLPFRLLLLCCFLERCRCCCHEFCKNANTIVDFSFWFSIAMAKAVLHACGTPPCTAEKRC